MNISNRLREYYVFPPAGFVKFPNTNGYVTYDNQPETPTEDTLSPSKTFIPTPDAVQEHPTDVTWRIDGGTFGTQYWAVPLSLLPMPPRRIDVFIPDQTEWPSTLWRALDANDSTHMSDRRVASLGIGRYLAQALTAWSNKTPRFKELYTSLPFGSSIVANQLSLDPADMDFSMEPNNRLEETMLSASVLQNLWSFASSKMPEAVPLSDLLFLKQLQKSISLVTFRSGNETPMILKSRTNRLGALYHEIKSLLTIPPCQNTIGAPLYLTTTWDVSHKEYRVCGFLIPYLQAGALEEALPCRRQTNNLQLGDQVKWAMDVTKGLLHVHSVPGMFCSDLKMDNILLLSDGKTETAVLVDFEQGRNLYNWAAPEIYYVEWIGELGERNKEIEPMARRTFSEILIRYLHSKGQSTLPTQNRHYDNPPSGWHFPWVLSTPEEQESSVVYSLGKVLWCIFEGLGEADNILGRSIPVEFEQRFPEFRHTPKPLRLLIQRCTVGAREWKDGYITIFRRGGKVFPLGKTGLNGEPEGTFKETQEAIITFWQSEMRKAVAFMEAKFKFESGKADEHDLPLLTYLQRPTLQQVLDELRTFASSEHLS